MNERRSDMEQRKLDETALAKKSDGTPFALEVKTLIVGAQPRRQIALGDPDGLVRAVGNLASEVRGIVWNEDKLHLILSGGDELRFEPEMLPAAGIFFRRKR